MPQSRTLTMSELVLEPQFLASYLLVFVICLSVTSSSVVRSQWSRLFRYGGESPKEVEKAKVAEIIASKDSSQPGLFDKYVDSRLERSTAS
jgi:hypothetical protein